MYGVKDFLFCESCDTYTPFDFYHCSDCKICVVDSLVHCHEHGKCYSKDFKCCMICNGHYKAPHCDICKLHHAEGEDHVHDCGYIGNNHLKETKYCPKCEKHVARGEFHCKKDNLNKGRFDIFDLLAFLWFTGTLCSVYAGNYYYNVYIAILFGFLFFMIFIFFMICCRMIYEICKEQNRFIKYYEKID